LSLAAITGNIGKQGAGFNYANLQSYIFDTLKEPASYYPDPVADQPFRRTISMARLGKGILETSDPAIKAIWVERGNPLLQSPDSDMVAKAFSGSEFTVVVEQFMTDTAKAADLILPAIDIFEQPDIIGSYWSPYVQFKPAVLEPLGECMAESDIYYNLSAIMGLQIPEGEIPAPGNMNAEAWLEKRIEGYSGLKLADLKNGPVLAPGLKQIAYKDLKFETPSGKIELFSERIRDTWGSSPIPVYSPLRVRDNEAGYPLIFLSPNTSSRIHSQFGNLDVIIANSEKPAAEISAADAQARGIVTGDRIRLYNGSGSVITTARITGRLMQGMVVLHNGIWKEEGGGSNFLTDGEETDIGFGAAFHGKRIDMEKIK
jgi:anaerobic selenocysteine-containing dehydrogenase